MREYQSQAARDAQARGYGGESYWAYLDEAAARKRDYYLRCGDKELADAVFTRTLAEALRGNDGE
jgi:hypothetical protein